MIRRAPEPERQSAREPGALVEMIMVVVISAAGLMASWAGHQSATWNSRQSLHFVRAGAHREEATKARLQGELIRAVEVDVFSAWIEAETRGNLALARFYRSRMPLTFRATFERWLATRPLENSDAPATPFAMGDYRPPRAEVAERAEKAASAEAAQGEEATRISYAYNRAGVVFATAMFFGGIGQAFRNRIVRLALVAVTVVTWLVGLQMVLTIPAQPPRQIPLIGVLPPVEPAER